MTRGIRGARADALEVVAEAGVVRVREAGRTDRRIAAVLEGAPEALSLRVAGRGGRLEARLTGAPAVLTLEVPRGCPVRIRAGGDAVVEVDALSGPLALEARDGARVAAAGARALEAAAVGDARVVLARIEGVAVLHASGRAEIEALRCEDAQASATARGRARIGFAAGRLAALAADAADRGVVEVRAEALSSAVRRTGAAEVRGRGPMFRPLPAPPSAPAGVSPSACPSP